MNVGKNVWPMYRKTKLKQKPNKTNKNRKYQHYHDSYGSDCPPWCLACKWEKRDGKSDERDYHCSTT